MSSPCYRRFCRIIVAFLALLVCGCVGLKLAPDETAPTPPRDSLNAFLLEGRFSLRQEDKNHSGRLRWRHVENRDELLLSSPFGQGIAEIISTTAEATLTTSDGKQYTAMDVPALTEEVLGYRLPLALLVDWVRGHAAGNDVIKRDEHGRPLQVRYEDWRIDYEYADDEPSDSSTPPIRLFVERLGTFELRLRIDEWTSLPSQENENSP